MHFDLLRNYLAQRDGRRSPAEGAGISRRAALSLGAAAGVVAATGGSARAARPSAPRRPLPADRRRPGRQSLDDTVFDYADEANLADWAPSIYGEGDQRGALNEITPEKTAQALALIAGDSVETLQLGELMSNGFPAYVTQPPRVYDQRLAALGYQVPENFEAEGGILQGVEPAGSNRLSGHEERFTAAPNEGFAEQYSTTYQIGTQVDNLNHVGAGEFFYNGFRATEFATAIGTTSLGAEHMGPIVTRGVLLDVLAAKVEAGADDVLEPAANGAPVLRSNYRITVEDLEEAMDFGGLARVEPGDAVMIRTGWNQLLDRSSGAFVEAEVTRWGAAAGMPGIYLAEARYLAQFRPALIGSDTWALEVLGSDANAEDVVFPCHQELLMRHGIRIAESVVLDALSEAGAYEYVHIVTPQYAQGATAGNSPPAALIARSGGTTPTTEPTATTTADTPDTMSETTTGTTPGTTEPAPTNPGDLVTPTSPDQVTTIQEG